MTVLKLSIWVEEMTSRSVLHASTGGLATLCYLALLMNSLCFQKRMRALIDGIFKALVATQVSAKKRSASLTRVTPLV